MLRDVLRVLIVSNDRAVIRECGTALLDLGAETITARAVGEVWSCIADLRPTLVLTDLDVADGGASLVLEAVRAWSATTPVILVAARDARISSDTEFVSILRKPVSIERLREVVMTFGVTTP
jgi:DNA-binding NtrC family response regulator